MFFRETVGSLRAYFILVGIITGLLSGLNLAFARSLLSLLVSLTGVGFAVAYLYLGISLKKLLTSSPTLILRVLIGGACYAVLVFLFILSLGAGVGVSDLIQLAVTLAIFWYLYKNVRRLSTS